MGREGVSEWEKSVEGEGVIGGERRGERGMCVSEWEKKVGGKGVIRG